MLMVCITGCQSNDSTSSDSLSNASNSSVVSVPNVESANVSSLSEYEQKKTEEYNKIFAKQNNDTDYHTLITQTIDTKTILSQYGNYDFYPLLSEWPTIRQYNKHFPIECLRRMSDDRTYCIQKTDAGGLYYAFFYKNCLISTVYSKKILYQRDFNGIKIGDSIAKVEQIDPTTTELKDIALKYGRSAHKSKHLLKDGLIVIDYQIQDGTYVITEKNIYPDFKLKGKAGDIEYSYDHSILPQDYIH